MIADLWVIHRPAKVSVRRKSNHPEGIIALGDTRTWAWHNAALVMGADVRFGEIDGLAEQAMVKHLRSQGYTAKRCTLLIQGAGQ